MYILSSLLYAIPIVFCVELDDYIGGFAKIGQAPYVVLVKGKASQCTGAIIEESWILSAAHCFYKSGKPVRPGSVEFYAGIVDYTMLNVSSMQKSKAKKIILHPSYGDSIVSKHDIALVKLETPFKFNENVNKTYLSGEEWPINQDQKCVAAGFGKFDRKEAKRNTRLKLFEPYAEHGESACPCTRRFQKKRLVCLKPEKDLGVCSGDSGGALICNKKAVGVAHMIMQRKSCSFRTRPKDLECGKLHTVSVYMFICPYLNWLRESVPSVPPKPASCDGSRLSISDAIVVIILSSAFFVLIIYK